MLLGALVKGMDAYGILHPRPRPPFEGFSVHALVKAIKVIRDSRFHPESCDGSHNCKLSTLTSRVLDESVAILCGLRHDYFHCSFWGRVILDGQQVALENEFEGVTRTRTEAMLQLYTRRYTSLAGLFHGNWTYDAHREPSQCLLAGDQDPAYIGTAYDSGKEGSVFCHETKGR